MVSKKKLPVKKVAAKPAVRGGKSVASATAASILGTSGKSPSKSFKYNGQVKVKAEWAKYYQNLLDLRERLLAQMSGLAKESAQEMSNYSLHMADSGTDKFYRLNFTR